MFIKRPPLVNNEIYHIVLRGVADLPIFHDESDYFRGIFSLYEFNDSVHVSIRERRKLRRKSSLIVKGQTFDNHKRDLLVEILAFCFMPNHIHLLLKQRQDEGISKFMSKFGTGYAVYFNKKYKRVGHLFQGRFHAVHIVTDRQLRVVFVYIHINPTSMIEPKWKEKGIENPERVIKFLENYKWSSYRDYIGMENFPSVTRRDFLLELMNGKDGCKEMVSSWIVFREELKNFSGLALE